mmetsp:Transcript_28045/g.32164  ORF Transcript_28045/g.32164 Transcript_28045/m.32164 type:complete len:281 (-) Transcript_28045:345-1187(-)
MEQHVCDHPGCKKSFKSKYSLRRHMLSHLDVKKFKCEICGKRFILKQYLKEHNYIHDGKKPYKCPYSGCRMAFRQPGKLSMHKKTQHGAGGFDEFEEEDRHSEYSSDDGCTLDVDSMPKEPIPVYEEEDKVMLDEETTSESQSRGVDTSLKPTLVKLTTEQLMMDTKAIQGQEVEVTSPLSVSTKAADDDSFFGAPTKSSEMRSQEATWASTVSSKIDSWSWEECKKPSKSQEEVSMFSNLSNGTCKTLPWPRAMINSSNSDTLRRDLAIEGLFLNLLQE